MKNPVVHLAKKDWESGSDSKSLCGLRLLGPNDDWSKPGKRTVSYYDWYPIETEDSYVTVDEFVSYASGQPICKTCLRLSEHVFVINSLCNEQEQ